MKRSVWKWVGGLLVGSALAGGAAADGPGAPADSYHMNDRKLTIPITLPATLRKEIAKLSLYVSTDQGKTWSQQATAGAGDDSFTFDAPQDGSFWFNVSYTDKAGQMSPRETEIYSGAPQLKVVVDTKRPFLKLEVSERTGDVAAIAWEARDEALEPSSVKLEFKAEGSAEWRPLDLGGAAVGQKRFTLGTSGPATLRLMAADRAGNQSLQQTEVVAKAAVPNETAPASRELPSTASSVAAGKPSTPPAGAAAARSVSMAAEPPTLPMAPAGAAPSAPPFSGPGSLASPSAPPTLPVGGDSFRPAGSSAPSNAPTGTAPLATALPSNLPPAAPTQEPKDGPRPLASSQPLASHQPYSGGYSAPGRAAGAAIIHTNQTRLELDYEIPKMGPSGVGVVELWVTMDNGRTWKKASEKTDPQPPFVFDAPNEGVYGFTMIVKSKAGLGRREPSAGDAPELRVEIDTTQPLATLYPVEADPRRKDLLYLIWKADDKNLGPQPVSLLWAEKQGGPWHPIAADQANTGRYQWRTPEQMPYRIFLRLEVRDLAGNVSIAETPEPVLVDLTEPEIRIKGLLPAGRKQP